MKFNIKKAAAAIEESNNVQVNTKHTILVVDDEEPNLNALKRILGSHYLVETCSSAAEALQQVDDGREFSVILSDYRMPVMDGTGFFIELKKRQHPAPRIMITGFAALDNVISAVNDCDVFQYVTKPFESSEILAVVKEAVDQREIKDENGRLLNMVLHLLESNAQLTKENESLGGVVHTKLANDETKPKKLQLSILFADVRGFTSLLHDHEPDKVIQILQKLFKPMHSIVYDSGGLVDKHLGDGLMAVFGITGSFSTAVALNTARKLVPIAAQAVQSLEPPFNKLRVSFGLAAGEVVMGMLGSEQKTELAVIGKAINLANRLQEYSKSILSNEELAKLLGPFDHSICIYDPQQFPEAPESELIMLEGNLPNEFKVRDFPELNKIGIIRA